jgi:hypothetical protein
MVVDEGRPIASFYFNIFPTNDSKFRSRNAAEAFVIKQARTGSKLHIEAVSVVQASRMNARRTRK